MSGRARYHPGMAAGPQLNRLQRLTYRTWLTVGVVVLLAAGYWALGRLLGLVIPPVLLAILIVYLLNPAVSLLERRGVPRLVGAAVAYLAVAGLLTAFTALLLPALSAQLAAFATLAPDFGQRLADSVNEALRWLRLDVQVDDAALSG
jgi:predicted PurR-regulated permease PerM